MQRAPFPFVFLLGLATALPASAQAEEPLFRRATIIYRERSTYFQDAPDIAERSFDIEPRRAAGRIIYTLNSSALLPSCSRDGIDLGIEPAFEIGRVIDKSFDCYSDIFKKTYTVTVFGKGELNESVDNNRLLTFVSKIRETGLSGFVDFEVTFTLRLAGSTCEVIGGLVNLTEENSLGRIVHEGTEFKRACTLE